MKLHLLDDLPLFRTGITGDIVAVVRETMVRLASGIPAELTYVGYDELERRWREVIATECDSVALVGTRPPLLTRRTSATTPERTVRLATRRTLDHRGRTAFVHATGLDDTTAVHPPGRLLIADDVAMSATTILAVLDAIRPDDDTTGSVIVRTMFATRRAVERIQQTGTDIATAVTLNYEPITEGTAIFLWDLLYGTLRGTDFLDQTELLLPFFGTHLAPLHDLRRAIDETTPSPDQPSLGVVNA